RDNKSYLMVDSQYKDIKKEDKYFSVNSSDDEEIVDFPDYLLGSRSYKPKVDISSKLKIDDYIKKYIHMSSEEIIKLGYTDHVLKIVEKYEDEVFIAVHIPSAICEIFDPTTGYLGFERGLIAFHDYSVTMKYLLERCYEEQLEWAKAYAMAGAHAYIISESYISPDLVNPNIYRNFMKNIHRGYFKEVENIGLVPICMFWGDVSQILEDLTEVNIKALMVEESKKGFNLDIKKIRDRIGNRVCIFGNLDSINLLHNGTPEEVRDEVIKQVQEAKNNFIIANGSPITIGTPEANIKSLINTGKGVLWN
ncbi:MAG: uroporphyrinogen decarboxylase family protein, partial [Actinomycetota bacterium]